MASLPGWRLTTVNGTRKAVNPQGETVSYNQYLNAQAVASGFTSHSAYVGWQRKNREFIKGWREKADLPANEKKKLFGLGTDSLNKLLAAQFTIDNKKKRASEIVGDKSAGGALALLLEETGLREKGALYDVGDSPK